MVASGSDAQHRPYIIKISVLLIPARPIASKGTLSSIIQVKAYTIGILIQCRWKQACGYDSGTRGALMKWRAQGRMILNHGIPASTRVRKNYVGAD